MGQVRSLSGGTTEAPAFSFKDEHGLGMYLSGPGVAGFSSGGNAVMLVSATSRTLNVPLTLPKNDADHVPEYPVAGQMYFHTPTGEVRGYYNGSWGSLMGVSSSYSANVGDLVHWDTAVSGGLCRLYPSYTFLREEGSAIYCTRDFILPEGSSSIPACSFSEAPDAGFYSSSGVVYIVKDSTQQMAISSSLVTFSFNLNVGGPIYTDAISLPDGSESNPSMTFTDYPSYGFYRSGTGILSFSYGGSTYWSLNSTELMVFIPIVSSYEARFQGDVTCPALSINSIDILSVSAGDLYLGTTSDNDILVMDFGNSFTYNCVFKANASGSTVYVEGDFTLSTTDCVFNYEDDSSILISSNTIATEHAYITFRESPSGISINAPLGIASFPSVTVEAGAYLNLFNDPLTTDLIINSLATSDADALYVDSSFRVGVLSSSLRYKTDVLNMSNSDCTSSFMSLSPASYNMQGRVGLDSGLIAEEVCTFLPEAVTMEEGEAAAINYAPLPVLMIPVLQDVKDKLDFMNSQFVLNPLENRFNVDAHLADLSDFSREFEKAENRLSELKEKRNHLIEEVKKLKLAILSN